MGLKFDTYAVDAFLHLKFVITATYWIAGMACFDTQDKCWSDSRQSFRIKKKKKQLHIINPEPSFLFQFPCLRHVTYRIKLTKDYFLCSILQF